ncbi:MAG: Holliday junction resolvase RuvX [Gammaproteobacteria bacterium]|nr:Holliday junction resolvase RuvX [Gammaproteobacteria bacterium]
MPDLPRPGTYLGFDYGRKRIGVAVGQTISRSASALEIIQSDKDTQWRRIEQLVQEWQPVGAIVGMPNTADGQSTNIHQQIKKFIAQLQIRFKLQVYEIDERLSSFEARDLLSQSTKRRIAPLDDTAAAVILQTWLDEQYDNS